MSEQGLPTSAEVVVIGGGIIGCSTLYHLAKLGMRNGVLVERKQLTCGSTWHSAAQVRQLRSSRNLTRLIKYSTDLYASLEQETGQSTGWLRTGSLSIATHPDRMTHILRQSALADAFGVETHVIGPREAAEMWPMMRADDVLGAVYSPDDGRVNPSDLCLALVKGAKANGGRICEDTEVVGFDIVDGRIRGVRTNRGEIACDTVVNCAGLWGRRIGAMAGVAVPLYACEHFYLLTKPIEGVGAHLPTLSDHDGHLYIRDEVGGLLVGCFEPEAKPLALSDLPKDFAFDLLNEDWDHFEPMMLNALHRIPALETAEARMLLNGPESFTPDGSFLLGEAPEVRGFFVACGMNSVGIATGGGAGRAIAEWIVHGHPTMDLWPVDIRRFARVHANQRVLRERVPEELGLHYAIGFPGREPETARGLRRSPVHDRLAAKGAQFGPRLGWERANWFAREDDPVPPPLRFGKPAWFDAVARECKAAREGVVVFDQTSFGKLLVQGPDAETVLQRLCANDVAVDPGRVVYTGLLNERGGYESDLTVFRLDGRRYMLVTGTAQPVRDLDWIHRNLGADERVTVTDIGGSLAVFSVMGPESRALLSRLTAEDLSNTGFDLFTAREIDLGSALVRAARLSYIGELGWELYVPVEMAAGLYDELTAAGGDLGLKDAGMYALTSLRIEKGYRAWGHDVTPDDTPLEAGLAFATKLKSGIPFIGRKALLGQKQRGLSRRLIHLRFRNPAAFPLGDEPIVKNGAMLGQVTSAAYSHTLGTSLAMGYVALDGRPVAELIEDGGLEVRIAGDRHAVDAATAPFFDPKGDRMKV